MTAAVTGVAARGVIVHDAPASGSAAKEERETAVRLVGFADEASSAR